MQEKHIQNLEAFLARTGVLIRQIRTIRPPSVPGNEPLHHELAQEFSRRLNALGNGRTYLVVDHTTDNLSDWDGLVDCMTEKHASLTGSNDNNQFCPSMEMAYEDFEYFREPGCQRMTEDHGLADNVFLITPQSPEACQDLLFSAVLLTDMFRMAKQNVLFLEDYARITLYHEGFGHGTEPNWLLDGFGGNNTTNQEMRADIASMAGILRDGASIKTAHAIIHLRNLSSLRQTALHADASQLTASRMGGNELKIALKDLEATPNLTSMPDTELVKTIDRIARPLMLDEPGFARRVQTLEDSLTLVRDTLNGEDETCMRLAEENPERLDRAISFLQDCMEAHALFLRPENKCKAPTPKVAP